MPHRITAVRFVLVAALLASLAACSGGGLFMVFEPLQTVGPAGGTILSGDGRVTITIPAGALPSDRTVFVNDLDASIANPAFGGLPAGTVFYEVLGLDDLTMPVTIAFQADDPELTPAGTKQGLVVPLVLATVSGMPAVPAQVTVNVDTEESTSEVEITTGGSIAQLAFVDAAASGLCATADIPVEVAVGQSDQITLRLEQTASSLIDTAGQGSVWTTIPVDPPSCVAFDANPTPFAGSEALVASVAQVLVDQRPVAATAPGSTLVRATLTLPGVDVAAALPGFGLATSTTVFSFAFEGVIECVDGGPNTPFVFPLVQYTSPEAMRLIPDFPFATTPSGAPAIIVAATGGVEFFDPASGTSLGTNQLSQTTYFDAAFIPPPAGQPGVDPGLFGSGNGFGVTTIDPQTGLQSGFVMVGGQPFLASDIDFPGGDPANGILVVDATNDGIALAGYDTTLGVYVLVGLVPIQATAELFSAVADATATRLLAIDKSPGPANPDQLLLIDRSTNPATIMVAATLGFDARRIRWDPASGIAAVSNRLSDSVTILDWDGIGLPTVTATAAPVAAEPIGLDVFGNHVAVPGFGDDQLTVITINAGGGVDFIDTQPLPAAIDAPGHALFLRDAGNSIVVSGNGSDNIAYLPNAF